MAWGIALLVVIGIAALMQLLVLHRQRRLFLRDPQRRRFFLNYVREGVASVTAASHAGTAIAAPTGPAVAAPPSPGRSTATPAATDTNEAVVYVDATGECTFANQAARELLHWNAGTLALHNVLAGGRGESDALMESLARRGLVEQHASTLAGPTHAPLEISAVAVRDRDDNLWGAAVFIRRAAGAPVVTGHSRRVASRH